VTTTSFAGKTGTDAVFVGNATVSYLPANRAVLYCLGTLSTEPGSNVVAPLFELTIVTDCGIVRKPVTSQLFGGDIGVILPVQGLLQ
jgi:hypothetical protein